MVWVITIEKMSIIVMTFGGVSFLLGMFGELAGTSCIYSSELIVALGYGSLAFLWASAIAGYISIFYPYSGIFVPPSGLFKFTVLTMLYFFAWSCNAIASIATMWATLKEQYHWTYNIYPVNGPASANPDCDTPKSYLMGYGAFLSLGSTLFWLFSLMLLTNARQDYLREIPPRV